MTLRHLEERYCVRCYSTVGYDPDRPEFCSVCWKRRRRLPSRVLRVVRAAQEMLAEYPGRDHLGRDAELYAALRALEDVE